MSSMHNAINSGTIVLMSEPKVRKAVIAAAGYGTRFLPQTKAMPKEMLPLVDKPIIQHIVEELVEAGIEDIVIVTGYHKRTIEDHFDNMSADLRANLKQGNKLELLEQTKKISNLANFAYIRQKGVYGTATPLLNAAHLIGNEPFIFTYADDFIEASPSRFSQMIEQFKTYGGPILPCITVSQDEDYKRYGIVEGEQVADGVVKLRQIVEKPGKDQAPSSLASVGSYLLTPDIFDYLETARATLPDGEEFYLTTYGIQAMINDGKALYACEIQNGQFYDAGNPLEYLKTVFDFALKRDDIGPELAEYLRKKLQ
jgi:UTP--glucose-1-phosphate uridylyltransferase